MCWGTDVQLYRCTSPFTNVFRKSKIKEAKRLSANWQEGQGEFTRPVQPLPARLSSCADDAS